MTVFVQGRAWGSRLVIALMLCAFGAAQPNPSAITWPGSATVQTSDAADTFHGNLSGLFFDGSTVLWAVRNGPGTLFRLVFDGDRWTPDTTSGWALGKSLRYPDGTGDPDAEGVVKVGPNLFVSTERDNATNKISRNSVLRFDPASIGPALAATREWNLTQDLPPTGPNLGIEAITWVPDSFLVGSHFFDENKQQAYNPASYPDHGSGLFFLGLEANGIVYAYALDQNGSGYTRVASFPTGFPGIMELQFDNSRAALWAICDDTCQGRLAILRLNDVGRFTLSAVFERPDGMPNLNNEGFAISTAEPCKAGRQSVVWADDGETQGHAIRIGTLDCPTN